MRETEDGTPTTVHEVIDLGWPFNGEVVLDGVFVPVKGLKSTKYCTKHKQMK
jgi:hypothetical protein